MLATIKDFFDQYISPQVDAEEDEQHQLKLATAALLIGMMHQDHQVGKEEIKAVKMALKEKFSLTEDECNKLFVLAEKQYAEAVDYHQFTHLIAKNFTQTEKIKVIELLWSIAYADKCLDALEEHMVRKIADLIYVSHKDFLQTKHKVQQTLSG
ncbi:hypothetical protein SPBRAN_215 [uncultured Candidatus Thioglobus sp.]|nr:hypothetical protein SPBRAN_215 [uncultured Candidatus Thioglobus sp.]